MADPAAKDRLWPPGGNAPYNRARMTPFLKMHGLGNDFAVFDARRVPVALAPETARAIADRRLGIGCDQVIVIAPGRGEADAVMRVYNADGGEVESCGNGARCVARLLMEETGRNAVRIDSAGGSMHCTEANGEITVDFGRPRLEWQDIPLAAEADTSSFELPLEPKFGGPRPASAVSMGNPHCILFVHDADRAPADILGPVVETHALFPARTNVEFVALAGKDRLRVRVWERGVGITQACGTGACAAAVAAHRTGRTGRKVAVLLDGGALAVEWREADSHVLMTGPATLSYRGQIDLAALERAS